MAYKILLMAKQLLLNLSLFIFVLIFFILGCSQSPDKKTSPKSAKAFAFKSFPVLEYHLIREPEGRWSRTPQNFKKDLEWLYENGYYPMNLKDILTDFAGLPQGKKPVILTFDDSSSSQFRYLSDGTIDSECAVGIIKSFHEKHPKDWPMRATFYNLFKRLFY